MYTVKRDMDIQQFTKMLELAIQKPAGKFQVQ